MSSPGLDGHRNVTFRPADDDDLAFLARVYASTRAEEVAATGWPVEMQHSFLQQQHEMQHCHYRNTYYGAEWLIIERDGSPVGRLYRVVWPREIRVIDIALLPEARGAGIGTSILEVIQSEAKVLGKAVSIHIEKNNPARSLYTRLGFKVVEDKGVYDLMEWDAATSAALQ